MTKRFNPRDRSGYRWFDGLIYKGDPNISFKHQDPENKLPVLIKEAHCEQLDLSKKEDMERYVEVNNLIVNGHGMMSYEEKQYDDSIKAWRVLLLWTEFYYDTPDAYKKKGEQK